MEKKYLKKIKDINKYFKKGKRRKQKTLNSLITVRCLRRKYPCRTIHVSYS